MAQVMLEVVRLAKRYGTLSAIDDVSFSAREGDVVGLLGPNGAGKTTTIRLLTAVLTPTSGNFWVAGYPSTAPTEIRRRVGVLPESGGYPAFQTGREYLTYHARLYGLTAASARTKADSLLAEVGLEERAGTRISTYSRGMRQRLGIARALVNDPAVVFLDEPTLGLDPAGQFQVLNIVRDIARRRGATVLLSTHTLPEVERVCSSVVILHRGRVVVADSVAEVIRTAGVERSAHLRVPAHLADRTRQALAAFPDLRIEQPEPDLLRLVFEASRRSQGTAAPDPVNAALVAVAEAQVPLLSFELEGARLSDAFLKMTGEATV